jgi:D-alanyl-D-alanine carboxypeptidase/D-alanyl-D-alanine-endopeptidase (penicillin-binding protein 4)
VVAILLAGVGSFSPTSRQDVDARDNGPALGPSAAVGHGPSARPVPVATLGPMAQPTYALSHLHTALSRALMTAGPGSGALVYDLNDRRQLFKERPGVGRPPASVEKLYTTVAVMRRLGPRARLNTTILGTGHLVHGTWKGDLYLRGGGDPTFGDSGFNRTWTHSLGPTPNQLVAQLQRRGIKRVTGFVYADESLFDRRRGGLMTGYAPDTPDFGGQLSALVYDHGSINGRLSPALFALKQVTMTLKGSGIQARWSPHEKKTPRRARLLALVSSPPMSDMTQLMDVPSDDLYAELFAKQLGVLFGKGGTISAGAAVIRSTITDTYGLHPKILDGSGLSRADRSSPIQIVDLLRDVWHTPTGDELTASLPTVGQEGTVQGIGVKTPAQGKCVAKTGTLDGVTNLAGYCHARDHQTLAFALMIDGPPNWTAITLESRMIGAIAGY